MRRQNVSTNNFSRIWECRPHTLANTAPKRQRTGEQTEAIRMLTLTLANSVVLGISKARHVMFQSSTTPKHGPHQATVKKTKKQINLPSATWQALRSWLCWLLFTSLSERIFSSALDRNMLFVLLSSAFDCECCCCGAQCCCCCISRCCSHSSTQAVIFGLALRIKQVTREANESQAIGVNPVATSAQRRHACYTSRHVILSCLGVDGLDYDTYRSIIKGDSWQDGEGQTTSEIETIGDRVSSHGS